MDRDVAKEFEQILLRPKYIGEPVEEYETSGYIETLDVIATNLQRAPGNADFTRAYRKQITIIRSLLITALIEALDGLDRKAENLDGINALLENIAQARRIQNKNDLVPVVHLVIDNFNQYGIGADRGTKER